VTSSVVLFAALLLFWLLLSSHPTPLDLGLGVLAAGVVTFLNQRSQALGDLLRAGPRLLLYVPWLLGQIVLANLEVVRLVLHPRLPIDPVIVRFTAPLSSDLALTALGNSITLTPGTVTLDVESGTFTVHALTPEGATAVLSGVMTRRVGAVFAEPAA
jgi:multicomponent Na+:H+ antiporter subunit E